MFNISEWKQIGLLGRGTYGEVFQYVKDEQSIAYKKFYQENNDSKSDIIKEIGTYSILSSVGARRIYGFTLTEREIGIAMDCASTDLFSFFSNSNWEKYWEQIFYKSIESLSQIHSCGLVHADVKPQNILLYFNEEKILTNVVIADFGFCSSHPYYKMGTREYIAPELWPIDLLKPKTKEADIWALGITLLEFYTDEYIFEADDSNISEKNYNVLIEPYLKKVDKEYSTILTKMLEYNPKNRVRLDEPSFNFPKRNWAKPPKELVNMIPTNSAYLFLTTLDICCRFLFKNDLYPDLVKDATSLAKKWGFYHVYSDSIEFRLLKGIDYLVYIPGLFELEKYFDRTLVYKLDFTDFDSFCEAFSKFN